MANQRRQLTHTDLIDALDKTAAMLLARFEQKGMGTFASSHEILGILYEEIEEYQAAVHQRLSDEEKIHELLDIAVGAIGGIASIQANGVDW